MSSRRNRRQRPVARNVNNVIQILYADTWFCSFPSPYRRGDICASRLLGIWKKRAIYAFPIVFVTIAEDLNMIGERARSLAHAHGPTGFLGESRTTQRNCLRD